MERFGKRISTAADSHSDSEVSRLEHLILIAAAVLAAVLASAPARGAVQEGSSALTIAAGSVAESQVVAIGRDLVVEGEVLADAVAINGAARVSGAVRGDLIVLGDDAILSSSAVVRGDVFVLGGRLLAATGSRIEGRSASYPSIGAAWLTLLEGPSLGLSATSSLVLGAKLALLTGWLALSLMLLATAGTGVLSTSEGVRLEPVRNFFVGLTGMLALFLTTLLLSSFVPSLLGLPLVLLVVLVSLLLKLWGMVAVFHAVGDRLGWWVMRRRLLPLNAATLGLLVLGALKLIPWVGTWVWTVATLIGIGTALTTKLGRREPWFAPGIQPEAGL